MNFSSKIEATKAPINGSREYPITHMQKNIENYTPTNFAFKLTINDPNVIRKKINPNVFSVS